MRIILIIFILSTIITADLIYDNVYRPGRITYYDASSGIVACDIPTSEWPQHTAALSELHFDGGLSCGAYVRLKNGENTIDAMIVDLCPKAGNEQWCSGDLPHFDIGGTDSFSELESVLTGVKELEYHWIPGPVGDTPVKLRFLNGVNQYWVAIHVINHRYPVVKIEIQKEGGNWVTGNTGLPGLNGFFQFDFTGQGLELPYTIRITDQYGQVIVEQGQEIRGEAMWTGVNQFPLLIEHDTTGISILTNLKHSKSGVYSSKRNLLNGSFYLNHFDMLGRPQ